jgi:CBS domain-containing protein
MNQSPQVIRDVTIGLPRTFRAFVMPVVLLLSSPKSWDRVDFGVMSHSNHFGGASSPSETNMTGPTALPTFRLEPGTALAQAAPANNAPVALDSPAFRVVTDLTQMRAATTHPSTTLRQAEQIMIYQGVRMLFVVTDMPTVEGLITTTDLHGDKQMRAVHERGVRYDDLCVADVMTELAMLDAIDYGRLESASVGDAIATLKRYGRNHLLVVESATQQTPCRLRGVISRSQIERQLGVAIDITPIASSFSEIERALG